MKGPCLCGDPYCSSCGNPSQMKQVDAFEELCNRLSELNPSCEECVFLADVAGFILRAARKMTDAVVKEVKSDAGQATDYYKDLWMAEKQAAEDYQEKIRNLKNKG